MTAAIDVVNRILAELGPAPTARSLVEALIPEIADSCIVFRREANAYRIEAWAHLDPAKHPLLDELARIHRPAADDPRNPVATVGRSNKGVLVSWITRAHVERATDDPRVHAIFDAFGPRNIVVVPIRAGDYVLVAAMSNSPRKFYEDDLEFLTQLAGRIAPLLP
jgi:GAF domain-containing protein